MKKRILFIAIVACLASMFSACRGPQGPIGPMGPEGPAGSVNIATIVIPVRHADWQWDNVGQYYFVHVPITQLTADVYDYGTVTCYREYNKGTNAAYQIALPEVKHMMEVAGEETFLYEQTIDFSYGIGFVEIVVTISDYYYEEAPEAMDFRLNLMW